MAKTTPAPMNKPANKTCRKISKITMPKSPTTSGVPHAKWYEFAVQPLDTPLSQRSKSLPLTCSRLGKRLQAIVDGRRLIEPEEEPRDHFSLRVSSDKTGSKTLMTLRRESAGKGSTDFLRFAGELIEQAEIVADVVELGVWFAHREPLRQRLVRPGDGNAELVLARLLHAERCRRTIRPNRLASSSL